jgi:small subunit ribosomal protein S4e
MSKHLKRLAAPRTIKLHRKEQKWTIRPSPGPHPHDKSIPLGLLARDYLSICDTRKEVRTLISSGTIFVDGRARKNYKYPCGFMDVISIPKIKNDYRILYNRKGKLIPVPISTKDAEWKLCRIENKTILPGKKIQLNFHDGNNIIVKKDEYHTGDVVKYFFKDKKISDTYAFEKGNISMIIGGSHIGETANIIDINLVHSSKPNLINMKGDKEFSTITHHVFPIGKNKPVVPLPEVTIQ